MHNWPARIVYAFSKNSKPCFYSINYKQVTSRKPPFQAGNQRFLNKKEKASHPLSVWKIVNSPNVKGILFLHKTRNIIAY